MSTDNDLADDYEFAILDKADAALASKKTFVVIEHLGRMFNAVTILLI